MDEKKPVTLAAQEQEDQIARYMVAWANTFPDLPDDLTGIIPINYEYLVADAPCMALSTIQGTYITKRYILGGYQAEFQFEIIYRVKPGQSLDQRLTADEVLNRFGDWARTERPNIGDGVQCVRIEATSRSSLSAAYDNDDEDHLILMKMTYEVI